MGWLQVKTMSDVSLEERLRNIASYGDGAIQKIMLDTAVRELRVSAEKIQDKLDDATAVWKNAPEAPYFIGLIDAYKFVLKELVEPSSSVPEDKGGAMGDF